ncbi:uncharacterized protein LOC131431601 isoform X2 [Malaya genurostris]|uniref:uncharacterized protein LOC131431601 isoform X2 n=1 Tax=Malaya genurostris TaxID=325434 RepID=UPI0026F3D8AD|nr:uncharacterized protein LOC131431601 isoform X2 [Malaya genurostris]
MISVNQQSPADPTVPLIERRTPSRKIPSPYRTVPTKSRFTKSPNKVTRNKTFIAPNRPLQNGVNGKEPPSEVVTKAKCVSAGAVDDLREHKDCTNLVNIFQGEDMKFSDDSETLEDLTPQSEFPGTGSHKSSKKRSAIPVKIKSSLGQPIRSQRSIINGSDSKTIKFLMKLTTKRYFETLKYEIDRIKESDRKIQDQASSHSHSIMTLINRGVDFDRKMNDLREQIARLLLETREKDRSHQDTVNAITTELNESVCNLLLKNIEKDHELETLARKLRRSKKFDANTYKMLKIQLRKPNHGTNESRNMVEKIVKKKSVCSLPSKAKSENIIGQKKSRGSRRSITRNKSDWSSLSSMSSVSTGTDMLSDIEMTSDKKSGTSLNSQKTAQSSSKSFTMDPNKMKNQYPKLNEGKNKQSSLMKIFCCGQRSKSIKEVKAA